MVYNLVLYGRCIIHISTKKLTSISMFWAGGQALRRGSPAGVWLVVGLEASSVYLLERPAPRSHQRSWPADAPCLVLQYTSAMSGWRFLVEIPPKPSTGSDSRLSDVILKTNPTTGGSPLWKTSVSWCAGARDRVCWTEKTLSRMRWRIMTFWNSVTAYA